MSDPTQQIDATRALVAQALDSLEWPQKKLSGAVNISEAALSRYLSGQPSLSAETVSRILDTLETALLADQQRILEELRAQAELRAALAFSAKVNALRPPRITRDQAAQIRRKANATFKAESPAPEKKCGHAPNHEEVIA